MVRPPEMHIVAHAENKRMAKFQRASCPGARPGNLGHFAHEVFILVCPASGWIIFVVTGILADVLRKMRFLSQME